MRGLLTRCHERTIGTLTIVNGRFQALAGTKIHVAVAKTGNLIMVYKFEMHFLIKVCPRFILVSSCQMVKVNVQMCFTMSNIKRTITRNCLINKLHLLWTQIQKRFH